MSGPENTTPEEPAKTGQLNDCWNKIGVRGDRSCPELTTHVHCRNCPVYSTAATQLLDAAVPTDQLTESTTHYATARIEDKTRSESILIFRLGTEWLALPTKVFVEVIAERTIHALPHRRNSTIIGLVNVRGALRVAVSLGEMLGIGSAVAKDSRAKDKLMLVLKGDAGEMVVPVDEVLGVERYREKALKAVPATVGKATATYTKAVLDWNEKTVGVLDAELLFYTINRSMA